MVFVYKLFGLQYIFLVWNGNVGLVRRRFVVPCHAIHLIQRDYRFCFLSADGKRRQICPVFRRLFFFLSIQFQSPLWELSFPERGRIMLPKTHTNGKKGSRNPSVRLTNFDSFGIMIFVVGA